MRSSREEFKEASITSPSPLKGERTSEQFDDVPLASYDDLRIDHITIAVPDSFIQSPPASLRKHFTIVPGNQSPTRSLAIYFRDGTYLNFEGRPALKHPEYVGWALTTAAGTRNDHQAMRNRLPGSYQVPVREILVSPGGTEVQWEALRPFYSSENLLPYWVHDSGPRSQRVRVNDAGITQHACGALGMETIKFCVKNEDEEQTRKRFAAVIGVEDEEWVAATPYPDNAALARTTISVRGIDEEYMQRDLMVEVILKAPENRVRVFGRLIGKSVAKGLVLF
ncbi:hypothetical protein BAUCODRAFT_163797 [Baudoinia panamericana UAMH 10762]|uniref:Uncharacterized protein n=1 Tax=Baudoinia panamericana (strain UAMH 10762) TaxID=717646 RepID=M2N8E8_BAUPA|nr:uncharacterized protein BAUCODRAFT_163797 [Baudoinia panamericana UAMH 10762]EMD00419.1 hypothetical protein BAUCODRAFT_163797 [Baudoinia panamericana UAMH 10762]